MGVITERDRNRLAALTARIRPPHSLAAKLETLTDAQRAHYDWYSERLSAFIARNGPEHAYELTLNGYGPRLPAAIRKALFGEMPQIVESDTENDAARKWMEYLQ